MNSKRLLRWLLWLAGGVLVLALLAVATVIGLLRASLPALDGEQRVAGLQAPVTIERDDLGVPTLTASNRLDLVFSLGFVHGQDRFFQMDLSRRFAAGELAALLGPTALPHDQWVRMHRQRVVAREALAALPPERRGWVDAYAAGVNAGLGSLGARPPEYWVLRARPAPWQPEDTLLTGLAMALNLTPPPTERLDALLLREIGPAAFEFFYPRGTDWDAALDGSIFPAAPIPDPAVLDFRQGWQPDDDSLPEFWRQWVHTPETAAPENLLAGANHEQNPRFVPGSNAWAVDASVSATGAALVASDMHLGYSMPPPFYRARLRWSEGGRDHEVIAVTLPGTMVAGAGSNGQVAWAATAAELDLVDQIALEISPDQPDRYRVGGEWRPFERLTERIEVAGGDPVEVVIRQTVWGPVAEKTRRGASQDFDGQPIVERYVFQSPDAADFMGPRDLMLATNTAEALEIAADRGGPVINVIVGDRAGNVGWTVAGRLPRRLGRAGREIVSWADGTNGWDGWVPAGQLPRLSSPAVSRVFSGNHRKLGTPEYLALAGARSIFGARAKQIRDALEGLTNATPADLLAIQLDDRALVLEPWRDLLLKTLRLPQASAALTNDLAWLANEVSGWSGRATPDSVAYRMLNAFRGIAIGYVYEPMTARLKRLTQAPSARYWEGAERPVWVLLEARPPHLLNPRFSSYDDLLLTAIADVVRQLRSRYAGDLRRATWGQSADQPARHPFSEAVPALSRWLDARTEGVSGGDDMPRIHSGVFGGAGAVERFVVSPGQEKDGLFHMLGGQSGHFLSPFYRAGHDAWVQGQPTPLLPGPTRHTLRQVPTKK